MKYRNHLSIGYEVIRHKGKTLSSALVSMPYQDFVQNLDLRFKFEEAAITSEVEHRPDLISDVFYDREVADGPAGAVRTQRSLAGKLKDSLDNMIESISNWIYDGKGVVFGMDF